MANTKAKLFYTQEKYLSSLPIKDGQIIFVADSRKVCLDMRSQRYSYETIQTVEDEEELFEIENPVSGFYFTESTGAI